MTLNSLFYLFVINLLLCQSAFARGGVHSGGGQGVYDLKTGIVHFLDILSSEEVSRMDLAENPDQLILAKFPNCSKVTYRIFSDKYAQSLDSAFKIVTKFENDGASFPGRASMVYALHFNGRFVIPFHLRQLKDTSKVNPKFQIQLAIYREGGAFYQQQALALMPVQEIKWLLIKETLRFYAEDAHAEVTNQDLEVALRAVYKSDVTAFKQSDFYTKLMRPDFQHDYYPLLRLKEKFIVEKLNDSALAGDLRTLLQRDLKDYQPLIGLENGHVPRAEMKACSFEVQRTEERECPLEGEKFLDKRSAMLARCVAYGYLPDWAMQSRDPKSQVSKVGVTTLIFNSPKSRSDWYEGFDIETGNMVTDIFATCSQ